MSLAATPAIEDLKNALQICMGWRELVEIAPVMTVPETQAAILHAVHDLDAVARLLRAVLAKLEQEAR